MERAVECDCCNVRRPVFGKILFSAETRGRHFVQANFRPIREQLSSLFEVPRSMLSFKLWTGIDRFGGGKYPRCQMRCTLRQTQGRLRHPFVDELISKTSGTLRHAATILTLAPLAWDRRGWSRTYERAEPRRGSALDDCYELFAAISMIRFEGCG